MRKVFYWLAIVLLIVAIFFLPYVVVPLIISSYVCALLYNTIRYNELYMYTEETLRRVEYLAQCEEAIVAAAQTSVGLDFLVKEYK